MTTMTISSMEDNLEIFWRPLQRSPTKVKFLKLPLISEFNRLFVSWIASRLTKRCLSENSIVVFFTFDFDFLLFFSIYTSIFFLLSAFHNPFVLHFRCSLLFNQWKFFELCQVSSCYVFNLIYLLITFFVLHKSRFSRLIRDLPCSLFQPNGFQVLSCVELRNMWIRAMSKEQIDRNGINR